jgi:hypothetical protein
MLRVAHRPWAFADGEAEAIATYWRRRRAESPVLFNGEIYLCSALAIDGAVLKAELLKTDFASYLYWRETGYRDGSMLDVFGSALVRAADGALMLGVQRPGNVNAGIACLPGGFIDERDVASNGTIDIEASIRREIGEEAGLGDGELARTPGYLVIDARPQVSIAATYRAGLPATALRAKVLEHLARDPDPELADMVAIASADAPREHEMPEHVEVLITALFGDSAV